MAVFSVNGPSLWQSDFRGKRASERERAKFRRISAALMAATVNMLSDGVVSVSLSHYSMEHDAALCLDGTVIYFADELFTPSGWCGTNKCFSDWYRNQHQRDPHVTDSPSRHGQLVNQSVSWRFILVSLTPYCAGVPSLWKTLIVSLFLSQGWWKWALQSTELLSPFEGPFED